MCLDPLSAAAIGATVLGGALQMKGARSAERARSRAGAAEIARQDALRNEQAALFGQTLGGFDRGNQDARRDDLTDARGSIIEQSIVDFREPDPGAGIEGSAPKVVKDAAAKAVVDALAGARAEGKRLAALQGFGDLFADNQVDLNRSGAMQAQLGDFSRGSSAVLPLELEAANAKGSRTRGFGQLLQGVGQVAGLAGAFGAGPTWGDLGFGRGAAAYSKPVQFPWSVPA